MQLAHHAGLERHRHAGDALGDRQLLDGRFLADAAADHFAGGFFQLEFERRQLFAGKQRIGFVVVHADLLVRIHYVSSHAGSCDRLARRASSVSAAPLSMAAAASAAASFGSFVLPKAIRPAAALRMTMSRAGPVIAVEDLADDGGAGGGAVDR